MRVVRPNRTAAWAESNTATPVERTVASSQSVTSVRITRRGARRTASSSSGVGARPCCSHTQAWLLCRKMTMPPSANASTNQALATTSKHGAHVAVRQRRPGHHEEVEHDDDRGADEVGQDQGDAGRHLVGAQQARPRDLADRHEEQPAEAGGRPPGLGLGHLGRYGRRARAIPQRGGGLAWWWCLCLHPQNPREPSVRRRRMAGVG